MSLPLSVSHNLHLHLLQRSLCLSCISEISLYCVTHFVAKHCQTRTQTCSWNESILTIFIIVIMKLQKNICNTNPFLVRLYSHWTHDRPLYFFLPFPWCNVHSTHYTIPLWPKRQVEMFRFRLPDMHKPQSNLVSVTIEMIQHLLWTNPLAACWVFTMICMSHHPAISIHVGLG